MLKASLEEEAVILSLVKAEPLLGAKKMADQLQATGKAGPNLTAAVIYATLRKNGLSTREKRLEFAQNGTDRRMARLAQALSESARPNRAPEVEDQGGDV